MVVPGLRIASSTAAASAAGGGRPDSGGGRPPEAVQALFGDALSMGLRVSLGLVLLALVLALLDLRRRKHSGDPDAGTPHAAAGGRHATPPAQRGPRHRRGAPTG